MSEKDDLKQREVPASDSEAWRDAGFAIKYELGSTGYRPGLPPGEKRQPPTIKGG